MRNVSADLVAASRSLAATPAAYLAVEDRPPMAERVDVTPVNIQTGDSNVASLCGPLADGLFLRVYADGAGNLWAQRATLLGGNQAAVNLGGTVAMDADTGSVVAVAGSGDVCRVVWIHSDRNYVKTRTTSDGGATWSAITDVPNLPSGVKWGIAAAWTTSGEVVFLDYDPDLLGHHLCAIRYNNGWGNAIDSGVGFWSVEHGGMAADGDPGDATTGVAYLLVIDGGNGNSRVRGMRFNAATQAWAGSAILLETEPLSGFDLRWPAILSKGRGANPLHLLAWMENFTGNPTYSRTVYVWTPDIFAAAPPTPWQYQSHGLRLGCLARDAALDYLAAGSYGYSWPRYTASAYQRRADLGPYIVKLDSKQAEDRAGTLTIHLADRDGQLADAGVVATDGQMLRPGSTLNLGLGYVTANGPEYGYHQGWTITEVWRRRVRAKSGGATSELVLTCVDALAWLENVTTYYTQIMANISNARLLSNCLALVSNSVFVESNTSTNLVKTLVSLQTQAPFSQLFKKLLNECGLIAIWRSTQSATATANGNGVSLYGYAYWSGGSHLHFGDGGTPIFDAIDGATLDEYTHFEVYGGRLNPLQPLPVAFGEYWDAAALRRHERPLALKWHDTNLTTNAACATVAGNLASRHRYHRQRTEVITPYDPAPELGDVAQVSDSFLGLADATRYVREIETHLDTVKGLYVTKFVLEASIV
ncbi:MAG: hypothetical protein ACYC3S_18190 [Chloroflexota bacterium]